MAMRKLTAVCAVFDLPPRRQEGDKHTFFVSSIDLGKSRTGSIYYGVVSSEEWPYKNWYSSIRWWSDGDRVMLRVGKLGILNPHVDRSRIASALPELKQFRKFVRRR